MMVVKVAGAVFMVLGFAMLFIDGYVAGLNDELYPRHNPVSLLFLVLQTDNLLPLISDSLMVFTGFFIVRISKRP